jgi:signal transduction histidine kinase
LELAQINRDRKIAFSPVRIDEIVFNAIRRIKEKYIDRKILPRITYPESDSELIINGNEGLLEITFINIIDNACKFSEKNVSIGFIINQDSISIIIDDEGIGIPDDEIEIVSRPFKRASNVKFIGGYGIGLSLVKKILELHMADLRITSRLNEGTRFELKFRRVSE